MSGLFLTIGSWQVRLAPWPKGTEVEVSRDVLFDKYDVRMSWGRHRVVGTLDGKEVREAAYEEAAWAAETRCRYLVAKLGAVFAREVGGCGLAPVAAERLEGLVPLAGRGEAAE